MTGPASEKIARKFKCPVCVVVDGLVHNKHCLRGELVISSDCLYTSNKSILRAKCMRPYTTNGHVIGAEFITTVYDLNEKLRTRTSICTCEHQTIAWELTRAHRVFEYIFDVPFHDNAEIEPYNALFSGYNRALGLGFVCLNDTDVVANLRATQEFGVRAKVLVIVLPAMPHATSDTEVFIQFVADELERFCRIKKNTADDVAKRVRSMQKIGRAQKRLFVERFDPPVEPLPIVAPIVAPKHNTTRIVIDV